MVTLLNNISDKNLNVRRVNDDLLDILRVNIFFNFYKNNRYIIHYFLPRNMILN